MVYGFNPAALPDDAFLPGTLKWLVPGNECRLLDRRRTPMRVLGINEATGFFTVEILDFEDKGALWELPFEDIERCQFAQASVEACDADVETYARIALRLNKPLSIPAAQSDRLAAKARIDSRRRDVLRLVPPSVFANAITPDNFANRTGSAVVWSAFKDYMEKADLWEIESAFASQFVSNPHSGELVKGHQIVIAELGLASYAGKEVRDPSTFAGGFSRARRAEHILHRLAFVAAMFECLGCAAVTLYRGWSCDGPPNARTNASFISTTFSLDVAQSHFNQRDRSSTGVLMRQSVPTERLFMSFIETAQMNERYREAEAVLLGDCSNPLF
jgi:hypothetical protein